MMGDTEIRRTVRVVFYAVERVREAYTVPAIKPAEKVKLEKAGERLWSLHGDLLSEDIDRRTGKLTQGAKQLRRLGKGLAVGGAAAGVAGRELTEAVTDAADALAKITDLAVEAGLLG